MIERGQINKPKAVNNHILAIGGGRGALARASLPQA